MQPLGKKDNTFLFMTLSTTACKIVSYVACGATEKLIQQSSPMCYFGLGLECRERVGFSAVPVEQGEETTEWHHRVCLMKTE